MGQDQVMDGQHTISSSVHSQQQLHKLSWASAMQTLGLEEAGRHKIRETPSGNLQLRRVSDCSHGVIHFMGNRNAHRQEAWLNLFLPPD